MLGGLARVILGIRKGLQSDHFLEDLERRELHDVLGRLGLEPLLFASKWILTESLLGGRLAVLANLHETRHSKGTRATTAKILLDHSSHRVKHARHFLACQAGCLGNVTVDLGLGAWLDFGCRRRLLCGLLLRGLLLCHVQESFLLSIDLWSVPLTRE